MTKGKVLIYGASGAVGAKTARLLREEGYSLHLVARTREKIVPLAKELNASYTVTDINQPDAFAKVTKEAGSELAGLVYAIGTINLKSIRRLEEKEFLADFQINAMGAALAIQHALDALKKGSARSSIVLYSSVAVQEGLAMHASLSMAKGAVEGLTRALAAELVPNIRMNAIAPSILQGSEMSSKILHTEKAIQNLENIHALKRLGSAEDIAKLTAFLISDNSDWMTGQIIANDGGRSVIQV